MKTRSNRTSTSASTANIIENYDYYDDNDYGNDGPSETESPHSAIEWTAARTRNRRDLGTNSDGKEMVTYTVCVRLDISSTQWIKMRYALKKKKKLTTNPQKVFFSPLLFDVCYYSHSLDRNLSGMGIADITLLSGFEAVTAHLDKVST